MLGCSEALKATLAAIEYNSVASAPIGALVENNSVKANIGLTVDRLKNSPIWGKVVTEDRLKIVGARYDLNTGTVEVTA